MTNKHRTGNGYPLNPGKISLGFENEKVKFQFLLLVTQRHLKILRNLFYIAYKNNTRGNAKLYDNISITRYSESHEVLLNAYDAFDAACSVGMVYCCLEKNLYFKLEYNVADDWVRIYQIFNSQYAQQDFIDLEDILDGR
jgi:hypothetical protein